MTTEMENLLTRLDELMMEAQEKGYSFVFEHFDETDDIITTLYSGSEGFSIDIVEWGY